MLDYGSRFREKDSPTFNMYGKSTGTWKVFYNGVEEKTYRSPQPYSQTLSKIDYGRCWDRKNPGPPFRSGGPLLLVKYRDPIYDLQGSGKYTTDPTQIGGSPFVSYGYEGGFAEPEFPGDSTPLVNYQTIGLDPRFSGSWFPDVSNLGPEAFNKTKPSFSTAGVAQFLGEARDIPGQMKQTSKFFHDAWKGMGGSGIKPFRSPKRLSDDYLNIQFGWVPFISDINKMIDTYHKSEEYMLKNIKSNDRWMKRTRVLSDTDSRSLLQRSYNASAFNPVLGDNLGHMMRPITVNGLPNVRSITDVFIEDHIHIWAAGLFKIYREEFDSSLSDYASGLNALKRNLTLYGANINPSVLYKITPWSWLIDWFTNVGANIDNLNSQINDGVVAKYFYVMAHRTRIVSQETWFNFWDGPITCKWYRHVDTKQRVEGGPYGLGLSESGLSLKQLSILAALGLSRGH